MSDEKPTKPTKQKRISIEFPKDLEAVYANVAFISHTPAEMIVDFAQVLPRIPKGNVVSRIIMSPMHAKMLHTALAQNISNYERQFGEIRLPQQMSIADHFFKYPTSNSDEDGEPEKE